MILCEMCFTRIYRVKHHIHTNICQDLAEHHFCSHQCKMLWCQFVREEGYVPETYVEVFKSDMVGET